MSFNTPGLRVGRVDKRKDQIVIPFDVLNSTLDIDTVLDEINGASISYKGRGTAGNQQPCTRYELTIHGHPIRCLFVLNAIRATIEGDSVFHRESVNDAARLLP